MCIADIERRFCLLVLQFWMAGQEQKDSDKAFVFWLLL